MGTPYDWFRSAEELLARGDAAPAAVLLEHVVREEPAARSARECLARAYFDSGRYPEARQVFRQLVEEGPDDDYAQYGYGLALWRGGDFVKSEEHLAMACAMRPERKEYVNALRQVRATLRARSESADA